MTSLHLAWIKARDRGRSEPTANLIATGEIVEPRSHGMRRWNSRNKKTRSGVISSSSSRRKSTKENRTSKNPNRERDRENSTKSGQANSKWSRTRRPSANGTKRWRNSWLNFLLKCSSPYALLNERGSGRIVIFIHDDNSWGRIKIIRQIWCASFSCLAGHLLGCRPPLVLAGIIWLCLVCPEWRCRLLT